MSEWIQTRLGDEVDLLTGYPFQSKDYSETTDSIRLLRGDNIVQGRLRWEGMKCWPLEKAGEVDAYRLALGDVVLAMDRPWIEAGLKYAAIGADDLPCFLVQRVARLRGGPHLDTRYLRYLIGSKEFTDHVLAVQTGTAVPHISGTQIRAFTFLRPPLPVQHRIAHVLGTLDDKIESNRRTNETLEAMARTLFKSWFVDFDPVRAKVDGRQPHGLDAATATLFPASFEDSPLGPIPKGWRVERWGDCISLEYGKSLRDYEAASGSYPVYGTNGRIGWHDTPLCSHAGIVIGRKGAYRGVHYCNTPFFVIDTAFYVRPRKDIRLRWAYYEMVKLDINSMDSGSAIPSTSRDDFYALPVVVPPSPVQACFADLLSPFWDRQDANNREASELANLRDALLPKLLSGEVKVPDHDPGE